MPAQRRAVDGLAGELFAPILGTRQPRSFEVISWDAEQGLCLTVERDGALILIELEERDDDRRCYARTERFNLCARRQLDGTIPLDGEDRRVVDQVVEVVRRRESRLPRFERPTTSRRSAVREIEVDRVLIPEGNGHYYLNPYVGCAIGCEFCYVAHRADLSRSLEGLPKLGWGRYVDVKVNAPEVLREEVRRYPAGVVRMSPILTDPYQPLEKHHRITRGCLEVLLEAGFVPTILTRAARVVEDLELLRRFPKACVGFTVPTDDDGQRRAFEPGADPIEDRVEALERCHAAGLVTVAVVQPMLPMDVDRLTALVAPLVRAVRIDRMYKIERIRHLYARAGRESACEDPFFEQTRTALAHGFRSRGVVVDEMDDLVKLLDL